MLGRIVILTGVLVAGVLGYAATRPDSFRVERRTIIDAPPAVISTLINDFRRWAARVMDGPSPLVAKVIGLFMSMDKMVGGDFEAGLESLKTIAEKNR